jgi:hypothetical protein
MTNGIRLNGFNGARKALQNESDISEEIEETRGTLAPPVLHVAVITDVLVNPKLLSEDEIVDLETETSTPELVRRAPRNSVIGRIITRNQDHFDSSPRILFPMNIYDAEPVKPGEHVFVFFVDYIVNDQIGYWWKRVPQPMDTDDLSFTHADRKYQHNDGLSTRDKFMGETPPPPDFINGGEDEEQHTLADADAYKKINDEAKAQSMIVREPVARFTKRPGDKVIQGSNGARIVFGMDRTGPATDEPKPNSPTIDLVVGYGLEGTPTAPEIVENSRGEKETDKTPEKRKSKENNREGDPDFENDKTRVYSSAKTDIDQNLQLSIPGVPLTPGNAAALGVRSDQIRLDARQDIKLRAGQSAIVFDQTGVVRIIGASSVNLGNANPTLGVARLNDEITIDATTDTAFVSFMSNIFTTLSAMGNAFKALGVPGLAPQDFGITEPPSSVKGKVSKASSRVKSE